MPSIYEMKKNTELMLERFRNGDNNSVEKFLVDTFSNKNKSSNNGLNEKPKQEDKDTIELKRLKDEIIAGIKSQMVDEDYEEAFQMIIDWVDDNICTLKMAKELIKDPSALIEELGLYTFYDVSTYLQDLFTSDQDITKGLIKSIEKAIDENVHVDEIVEQILPVIEKDMINKDLDFPTRITKYVIKMFIKEGIKERNKINTKKLEGTVDKKKKEDKKSSTKNKKEVKEAVEILDSSEVEEVKADEIIINDVKHNVVSEGVESEVVVDKKDVKDETVTDKVDKSTNPKEDPIHFDDSNLVEVVKLIVDNENGLTVQIKDGTEITITHADLIEANGKMYVTHACYQALCDTQKFYNDKINIIKSNPAFIKLITNLDPTIPVRLDVIPGANDISLDILQVTTGQTIINIQLDLDGKYMTQHSKILLQAFNKLYALEIEEGLLNNIIIGAYTQEQLEAMNILSESVIGFAEHLDLSAIPAKIFKQVLENITNNKILIKNILSESDFYCFNGNITAKDFTLYTQNASGTITYDYKSGKVFKSVK